MFGIQVLNGHLFVHRRFTCSLFLHFEVLVFFDCDIFIIILLFLGSAGSRQLETARQVSVESENGWLSSSGGGFRPISKDLLYI